MARDVGGHGSPLMARVLFVFAHQDDEMAALSGLTQPGRIGPDPDTMNRA